MLWYWVGGILLGLVGLFGLALLIGHLAIIFHYIKIVLRIFQEKPLFIIPFGQPHPDAEDLTIATPDGLGLQEPRIKVEVKHRSATMGAQDIRSFLGGLRPGDRGLYVSTGGFTKEAKYEAERSNTPATLVDLDDLARLVVAHYDRFDLEGRALIPLVKVYWPAE